jgi:hypothetical protein
LTNIDYDTFEDRVKARTKKGIVTIRYLTSIINPFWTSFDLVLPPSIATKNAKGLGRRALAPNKMSLQVKRGELQRLHKPISDRKIDRILKRYNNSSNDKD